MRTVYSAHSQGIMQCHVTELGLSRAGLTMPPERHPVMHELDHRPVVTRYPDGWWAITGVSTDEKTAALSTRTVECAQWFQYTPASLPPYGATPKS